MKQLTIFFLCSLPSVLSEAPVVSLKKADKFEIAAQIPRRYFRNPLDIPIRLAANFGELRPNHYHMGLDIRTNQRENLPVYAAAEGYISKIKIERYGFGNAIYINHPNGYTTLYAHLNAFYGPLAEYIKQKQYSDQQWEQEFDLEPGRFSVTKGQFIAYSGNTGGSAGPHLHFEIRDTKTGNNLNPWLFDFGLPDNIKPSIFRLVYYDRRYSTYHTSPVPVPIVGNNGVYNAASGVVSLRSPYVSFGISAADKITGAPNYYGIYEAEVSVDGSVQSAFKLNDFSYDETRYINASIDYKTKSTSGVYIQHLSRLPGNYSLIFSQDNDGSIFLTDTQVHEASVIVKDVAGNTSNLHFKFRWDPSLTKEVAEAAGTTLIIPERENKILTSELEASFSSQAFYDTVSFVYRSMHANVAGSVSQIHQLHNYTVPVHDSFTVRIKPTLDLTEENRDKVVMKMVSNRKIEVVKGDWVNDWFQAKFRDLGTFQLLIDTISPRIAPVGWSGSGLTGSRKSISFSAGDNLGEIKNFTAHLDGKWLLFSQRKNLFIHHFDERTSYGRHELVVSVEDEAGNVTERTYTFTK